MVVAFMPHNHPFRCHYRTLMVEFSLQTGSLCLRFTPQITLGDNTLPDPLKHLHDLSIGY